MEKRIPLATPTMCGKEKEYVDDAFASNWIAPLGYHVDQFEREIAAYVGMKDAAALSSGTAGIHLALNLCKVGRDDLVFVSDLTFIATSNPIIYQGGKPVLIDSNEATMNMDADSLALAFKKYPSVKAVLVANLYGQPADMDRIVALCNEHNVPLIEDAAESLGATYKGRKSGTFGKFGIFSFNGNKIITTSGGGMVVSDDVDMIKKVRFLATQARDPAPWYQHTEMGYNYRLSNICAAIGRGQLTVLDERVRQKKAIYERYARGFKGVKGIYMMPIASYGQPNYWLSIMLIKPGMAIKPMDVIKHLADNNVESRPIWKPMHMQPLYAPYAFVTASKAGPMSEDIFNRGLCLPSDVKMTAEEQEYVIGLVKEMFAGK